MLFWKGLDLEILHACETGVKNMMPEAFHGALRVIYQECL
jgi:hypothetical protein